MPATWPPRTVIRKSSGLRTLESALYRGGLGPVAGVDEVGRGACAGPLVVAACVLGPEPVGEPGRARRFQEAHREGTRAAVSADPPVCAGVPRGVHPVHGGRPARGACGQYRRHAACGGGPVGTPRLRALRRVPGARAADAVAAGGGRRRRGGLHRGGQRAGQGEPRPADGRDGVPSIPATASPSTRATARRRTPRRWPNAGRVLQHRYSFINVRRVATPTGTRLVAELIAPDQRGEVG